MTHNEFKELSEVFRPRLLKTAKHKWGNEGEDIIQEAFLRAYESKETFRSECNFQTWILGYAKHIAYHTFKVEQHEDVDVLDLEGDDDVLENAAVKEWVSRLSKAEKKAVLEETNRMALYRARKKYES